MPGVTRRRSNFFANAPNVHHTRYFKNCECKNYYMYGELEVAEARRTQPNRKQNADK